jgi:hypothetical protein
MRRAARLLAVYDGTERRLMIEQADSNTSGEQILTLLEEVLRAKLGRIVKNQDLGPALDDDAIDAKIDALEDKRTHLRRQANRGEFDGVEAGITEAARRLNMEINRPLAPKLGRRAVDLAREILALETQVLEGDDARSAAVSLVAPFSTADVDDFIAAPITLSRAIAKTFELYPSKSMKGNIDAIAQLALAYFGDVAVTAISESEQEAFFAWMARLPKNHGKRHGKNRFCRNAPKDRARSTRTKHDEIAEADAADAGVMEEIRGLNHLSDIEKRALLSERLVERLTMTTIRRNRDGLNRIFKAAAKLGCRTVPTALSYKDIERHVAAQAPDDPLYVRVTKPKLRMPRTEERLAQFLTSPIYTGCMSEHRRWRRGTTIVRDALYWVPLIVLTIGSRIGEILVLKRRNLVYRDGTYCLAIGLDTDQSGKTADAERVVPIPQLLLDLGFVEWVQHLPEAHGPLLFPDAVSRSEIGDVTGPFSKALNRIPDRLGLGDFDEDFYAMRKTLSSLLRRAGVEEGQRQAIAGHRNGTILNRHYTAHYAKDLKTAVDRADFQLSIVLDRRRGFPTITSCDVIPGNAPDLG